MSGSFDSSQNAIQEEIPNFRSDSSFPSLEFTVGDPVVDGVEGAVPLKPRITGGERILEFKEARLYWKPPADKPTYTITLPAEVDKNRRARARCPFSTSPIRTPALILAFNHE